ncbi:MAG: pilus assembly protein PilP, partial [Nitrososphaera sp.]|nr:pilus assembly protein PilP [Nitrososphaera sp.]
SSATILVGGACVISMCAMLSIANGAEGDQVATASQVFRYDEKGRRDPFVPLVKDGRLIASQSSRSSGETPVLYGVLWEVGGRSIALINDVEARVGDMIGEYKVVEIREDAVVLESGGESVVLKISFDKPPSLSPHAAPKGGEDL